MAPKMEPNAEPIPGYRLIEELGRGGYGEVWRAEAPGGLPKAVKRVFGLLSDSPDKTDEGSQVERELKGLMRIKDIRHPFLLTVERIDIIEGNLYIVSELADRDLTERLKECQQMGQIGIPRVELLKYMLEVSEALDLMNVQHNIQHLDIKPSNIFLVGNHVKVADFGLAKVLEGVTANLTSGMTPMYAAPESFNGWATRNTDQYSLAIVYQKLLTGTQPFNGPSPQQFMLQHLTKEPNVAPLPIKDQSAVRRAMAKDPEKRFPTCTAFVEALLETNAGDILLHRAAGPAKNASISVRSLTRAMAPGGGGLQAAIASEEERKQSAVAPIIGIDLGTSNSVIAIVEGNDVKVITNQEGQRLTPSVVALTANQGRSVGSAARRQATTNPTRVVSCVKRFMGRRFEEVVEDAQRVSYQIIGSPGQPARVQIDDQEYAPPEISAMILQKLKLAAEAYLGQEVNEAVITVPAYFNDSQRQATKDAGAIAGLDVKRIINEPTAAALAYGIDEKKDGRIAVFDLGGGTFDITILTIRDGVFDVLSTNGDTYLGGDDFDNVIVLMLVDEFQRQYEFDPRGDKMALSRLREAAERAKIELSTQEVTDVNLPFLAIQEGQPKHLVATITRTDFEDACSGLVERCKVPCVQALTDAKLQPADIDEVVLVGGSTRMPMIQRLAHDIFGKSPHTGINPDEAVAVGAAIQGGILNGGMGELLLLDVTPLSLGIEDKDGLVARVIDRNTTIPTVKKQIFTTAKDSQTEVGIHVVQGERDFATDNRSLARFWLQGIRPAPAGVPEIEVSFKLDANGILEVAAKDRSTNNQQTIRVESNSGLTTDQIDQMRVAAEAALDQDGQRREMIELKRTAERACRDAEKASAKLESSKKKQIEQAITRVEKAVAAGVPLDVTSTLWQLRQIMMGL